jgi:putative transposase
MPFWRLYYHLVWSTKDRLPLIDAAMESRLFPYLRDKAHQLGCKVVAVNGWVDHVHIVICIPPKLSIAEVVQALKGSSSHDIVDLYWQRGYGAFSLGESQSHFAVEYVNNQKEHHAQQTTNQWLERCED